MDPEVNAPDAGGGEAVTVVTPAESLGSDISVSQAAKALAAARHKPKPAEAAPNEAAPVENELADEANAAPVEEQAPGEDATEAEPAQEPPIERPRSWTKDEDAEWQSLPRAMQLKIVAREQERDTGLRRSQNEAAEQRKAIEAERQKAEQARQQLEAKLLSPITRSALVEEKMRSEFPDVQNTSHLEKLQREDPFGFQRWQFLQTEWAGAKAEESEIAQRKAHERQINRANYEAQENARLIELVPDVADPKKAGELRERAVAMLTDDLGLKNDQLSRWMQDDTGHEILSSAGIQKLIVDGLRFREIQEASKKAVAKPVPPVQRPGTARPNGAAQSEQLQALTSRLNSSGSLKDAAAVLAARRARR